MFSDLAAQCRRALLVKQPGGFDAEALLLGYSAGELTAPQERVLFEAAAHDQDLFDQLMEAEAVRHALTFPEERDRAGAVLRAWEQYGPRGEDMQPLLRQPAPSVPAVLLQWGGSQHRTRALWMDLLRPVISTVTTTL